MSFAVAAEIQLALDGGVAWNLGAGPFTFASPRTILALGTEARPPGTKEPGEAMSARCYAREGMSKGEHTLNGVQALTYARTRDNSCDLAYTDINHEQAQRGVIAAIKARLTDPLRLPYNLLLGPISAWDATRAFVSDLGAFTMPQLLLAAAHRWQLRSRDLLGGVLGVQPRRPRLRDHPAPLRARARRQPAAAWIGAVSRI